MSVKHKPEFLKFLRMMSKKGFYEIFRHVEDNENIHYNDVLRYAFDRKVVDSRGSITIILNGLTELGLLERNVIPARPIRTTYRLSRKGHSVSAKLKDLETIFD